MLSAFARGGADIDGVVVRDAPIPQPGPGEALVRLTAATLNYRDLIIAKGLLPGLSKEPDYVPLSCAAGEVVEIGDGVTRVKPGDRVSPLVAQGWIAGSPHPEKMLGGKHDGVARQYAVFDAESLCLTPDALGDLEAACLPCAGLAAWSALFGPRPLRPGEWMLAQGTGGVSTIALQWAKTAGAHVAITSSCDRKLARASALGADVAINYRRDADWVSTVHKQIGSGVDIVVDVVGDSQVEAVSRLVNKGGLIAAVGMLDGAFSWSRQEINGAPVKAVGLGNRSAHEAMLAFAAAHHIRPAVDIVYDLARLPDAMRRLEEHLFFGKIGVNLL